MRAAMAAMAARIDALEAELAETEAKADAASTQAGEAAAAAADAAKGPTIAFKGAPEFKGEGGWSFKPHGRLQYDAGFVSVPSPTGRADGFGIEEIGKATV